MSVVSRPLLAPAVTAVSGVTRYRHPSLLSLFCVRTSRVRVSTKFSVKANLPDMRAIDTHRRPPEGEDNDLEMLSVKPSFPVSDGPPPSKRKKKNKDVRAEENLKAEGRREGPFQASSSFSKKKRSKKRQRNPGIDLEELLARTYPKEIPMEIPMERAVAQEMPAEASSRRSTRKKKRPLKEFSDHAKKWSADEEISIAKALLECSSPDGEMNVAAFYQRAKESLPDEVSNSQLYDKMRNMKKRFRTIVSKLKEQNVPEDKFPYRTRQELALFAIWKQIWGNSADIHEIRAENPNENGAGDLRLIEPESPRKSRDENFREIENENPRVNGAHNFRENRDEDCLEIESESPKQYEIETPWKKGAGSLSVNGGEREMSEGTGGENPRNNGSDSTRKINVSKPRASGVDEDQHEREEKEDEEHSPQNSMSHETPNTKENGGLEDTLKILLDQTESRLQASIANAINRAVSASPGGVNYQPFGGFGVGEEMEIFLSRKMKELMEGVNSAKEFPGLDAAETQELQRKWHRLKIQELRMFCDSLELLQEQCRLFLKKAETSGSNDNHTS